MSFTAVVTGATGGIGKEIVRGLLRAGAIVIIGVRDTRRGEAVRHDLAADGGTVRIRVLELDISNTASVRRFAAAVASEHKELNLLVNNAGALFNERRETPEGHELTFATNALGPYLLAQLLFPLLSAGEPARIVNAVSSLAGNYDVDDLDWRRRKYNGMKAYAQSKQALRMMTWILAQELEGTGVVANAASPGFVKTDFLQTATGLIPRLLSFLAPFMAVTPAKGAETAVWVALSPELKGVSAKYFEDKMEKEGKFRDQSALDVLRGRLDAMSVGLGGAGSVQSSDKA